MFTNFRVLNLWFLALSLALVIQRAQAQPVGSDNYTNFIPTTGAPVYNTQIVYVSASQGNDSNNGLTQSTPVRSLARGYQLMREGYPDWMLLKRGDVFNNERFPDWAKWGHSMSGSPGGDVSGMMLIGSYGSGSRPEVKPNNANGFKIWQLARNVAMSGIAIIQNNYDGTSDASGFFIHNPNGTAGFSNYIIEDCLIKNFATAIVMQGTLTPNSGIGQINNVFIRFNVITGQWRPVTGGNDDSSGMYLANIGNWTIEQNFIDNNGGAAPDGSGYQTYRGHGIYIDTESLPGVLRANVISRSRATGASNRVGGTMSDNTLVNNPINAIMLESDAPASHNVARGNVAIYGRDIITMPGDEGRGGPRGFGFEKMEGRNLEFTDNIATQNLNGHQAQGMEFVGSNQTIERNIVYNWKNPDNIYGYAARFTGSGIVRNNIFQQPLGGIIVDGGSSISSYSFSGNRYFTTNPSGQQGLLPGGTFGQVAFPNANGATIPGYMASLGLPASQQTLQEFYARLQSQSRAAFDRRFTAPEINCWFQAQFGMSYRSCGGASGPTPTPTSTPQATATPPGVGTATPSPTPTNTPTPTATPSQSTCSASSVSGSFALPFGAQYIIGGNGITFNIGAGANCVRGIGFAAYHFGSGQTFIHTGDYSAPYVYANSDLATIPDGRTMIMAFVDIAGVSAAVQYNSEVVIARQTVSPTATPTAQATPTRTPIPTATSTPLPTATRTPVPTPTPVITPSESVSVRWVRNTREGSSQQGILRVRREISRSTALDVNYTLSGTAQNGVDYQQLSGVVRIPAGARNADVRVRARSDALVEPTESVVLTISPSSGSYAIGTPASAQLSITNVGGTVRRAARRR